MTDEESKRYSMMTGVFEDDVLRKIALSIIAIFFLALAPLTTTKATQADSVLISVAKAVCEQRKPLDLPISLSHKVATLNDVAESREMLQSIFGEREMVEQFFTQNTQGAIHPATGEHGCLHFSEFGQIQLSIPVFSKEGKKAFVYVSTGWDAGMGRGDMYEVTYSKGRWRVSQHMSLFVS